MNETIQDTWFPHINPTLCTGCGDCVAACPTGALAMSGGIAVLAEPASCSYCGLCESLCPVEAINLPYRIVMEAASWPTY
ncbi:MAG: ferredoxin family protein [Candidatus Promineofilum sp.]|nr:ferredoxin family protein [Promineifilum sp.]